jgi:hypothetical protein
MYNGIDVLQTRDYIKISTTTFIDKICEKYLSSCMPNFTTTEDRPTPLPSDPTWLKKFNAVGRKGQELRLLCLTSVLISSA